MESAKIVGYTAPVGVGGVEGIQTIQGTEAQIQYPRSRATSPPSNLRRGRSLEFNPGSLLLPV